VADQFVLVRLTRITGADLNVFDFDYDVTWMAFFLNADGRIYGRYGGRDAEGAEKRLSLAGLRYAMQAALAAHHQPRRAAGRQPDVPAAPRLAEAYPAAKQLKSGQCIHCHNVYEFQRDTLRSAGKWDRDMVWVYPPPENVGITLEVDRGDQVRAVAAGSAADKAGIRAGDVLRSLNGLSVASFADAQYALHRAPAKGRIPFTVRRNGQALTGQLELAPGWRETNITWRTSLLDLLPSLSIFGQDLSGAEKKALGLGPKRLAFRQDKNVHPDARDAGVRENDVVIGINNKKLEMDMLQFLGYVRRNFRVGERVTLNVFRGGRPVDLPILLR
jgi:hypothetical protein